ncbi:MAG: GAF domain-containing protein [Nitrospirae bacterium]|nr:GAF domain-containing protein [Nitrospirota bacterium]
MSEKQTSLIQESYKKQEELEKENLELRQIIAQLNKEPLQTKKELLVTSTIARVTESLLNPELTFYDIAKIVQEEASRLTESKHSFVSVIDQYTGDNFGITLTDMMDKECKIAKEKQQTKFPKGLDGYAALWGHSLNSKEGFYTNAPQTHPVFRNSVPEGHVPIERFLSVPAISRGKLIGQLNFANSGRDYNDNDLKVVTQLATIYSIAVERKLIEDQREELKNHILLYANYLEKTVRERTQKLTLTNEQLTSEIQRREQVERDIMASLKDKEILLKEIHHRVKNNLQIISSLLSLQSETITDMKLHGIFQDSLNRIRSMALIHEHLYKSADMSKLDFSEYIESMAGELIASYGAYSDTIPMLRLDIKVDYLDTDIAIPCGLIICELISNSMKYAFPGSRRGEICIALSLNTDGTFMLIVGDNGVGLPEDFDFKSTKSLGLMLVRDLITRKLRGSMEIDRNSGATFKMLWRKLP